MFCSKCGKELPEGAKFCPKCGNKITVGPTSELGESIVEATNIVADEINNTVTSVEKEVKNVSDTVNENFSDAHERVKDKINVTKEELKNFKFSNLKEKKYVDFAATAASVSPVVLMILHFVLFGLVGSIVFGLLDFVPFIGGLTYIFNTVLSILVQLLMVIFLIVSLGSLGLLIYRASTYNETKPIHIIEMVSSFIAFIAILGFFIAKVSWLRYFGFISLVFGFDFLIKIFVKGEEINEPLDYGYDFKVVKDEIDKIKKARAEEKAKDAENQNALLNQDIVKADINGESSFDGKGIELFGYQLLLGLLVLVTCGLAAPFMIVTITRWRTSHTVIGGKRLTFNGTALQLFGLFIKWVLLSIITCGIYTYFAYVDYKKWETKHTAFEGTECPGSYYVWSQFKGNSFEYLGYSILTGVVTAITCCIAYPWMQCLIDRWELGNTYINKQKLKLDLTGGRAFGTYFLVGLLTIITCGIYGPWGTCKINRMICSNTHIDPTYVSPNN